MLPEINPDKENCESCHNWREGPIMKSIGWCRKKQIVKAKHSRCEDGWAEIDYDRIKEII